MSDLSAEQARTALEHARRIDEQVRHRSRWYATYLTTFGVGFSAITLVLGLVSPLALRLTIAWVSWVLFMTVMIVWALRQPTAGRHALRRNAPYWAGTALLYAVTLFVGTPRYLGMASYWVPAAVLVSLPLVIGGVRERRR